MNTLNDARKTRGLTFEELGNMVGYLRNVVWKHCHADTIPAEASIRYSAALGIPLAELRPDLPEPVVCPAPNAVPDQQDKAE